MITELRLYRIKPGQMTSWLEFYEEAVQESLRQGIRVEYAGVDRETNTFVWLRSFEDEADRVARKAAFYGTDWWNERESHAMGHVLEYQVTFLDATIVRDGEGLARPSFPAPGDRPGSVMDSPPTGWTRSTRATFSPEG